MTPKRCARPHGIYSTPIKAIPVYVQGVDRLPGKSGEARPARQRLVFVFGGSVCGWCTWNLTDKHHSRPGPAISQHTPGDGIKDLITLD